jgi:hypothetical protein
MFRGHAAKNGAGTDKRKGWHRLHQPAAHKMNAENRVSQAFAETDAEARLDRLSV